MGFTTASNTSIIVRVEPIEMKDQNGHGPRVCLRRAGRQTADKVTTLGIRRVERGACGSSGPTRCGAWSSTYQSYDAATRRHVVNDVYSSYNDFGQLARLSEAHRRSDRGGRLGRRDRRHALRRTRLRATASGGLFTKGLRLTDVTYPNSRVLHYGVFERVGRRSGPRDATFRTSMPTASRLAQYTYLGLGRIVKAD